MSDPIYVAENVRLASDLRTARARVRRLEGFVERVAQHDYPILARQARDLLDEDPSYAERKGDGD